MTISTKSLRAILDSVRSCIGKRTSLVELSCVRMEAVGGILTVSATDIDQWQEESVACDGDLPAMLVNFTKLCGIIGSSDSVSIEDKYGKILVTQGNSRCHIATLPAETFPKLKHQGKLVALGISCEDLAEGIRSVAFAACKKDIGRPELETVHINASARMLLVEACNGKNGAFFERPLACCESDIVVMDDCAPHLAAALLQKGAVISKSQNFVQVQTETGSYACKLVEAKYPNTAPIRNQEKIKLGEISRVELLAIMEQCVFLLSPTQRPRATITFSEAGIDVKFDGLDSDVDSHIDGKFASHEFSINVEAGKLCLGAMKEDRLQVFSNQQKTSLWFQAGDLTVMTMENK